MFSAAKKMALAGLMTAAVAAPLQAGDSGELFVTHAGDSGAGSFRAAIEAANENSAIGTITFKPRMRAIHLQSPVSYEGEQALSIQGGSNTLTSDYAIQLFESANGDLEIKGLNFTGGQRGIVVTLTADAEGDYNFSLTNSIVRDQGGFGILIDDQGNELELVEDDGEFAVEIVDSTINSAASVNVTFANVAVLNTGFSTADNEFGFTTQDEDGIRINEGGMGDLLFTGIKMIVTGNAGDGVEIDETGSGDAIVIVNESNFSNNGSQPQNLDDLEDGFDIDEAGDGEIFASLRNVLANGNNDEGIDFDEEDEGDVRIEFANLIVNNNTDDGISVDEEDDGDVRARVLNVVSQGNGDDGIDIDEDNDGVSNISVARVTSTMNAANGIDADEDGDGGTITVRRSTLLPNGEDDISGDLEEQ